MERFTPDMGAGKKEFPCSHTGRNIMLITTMGGYKDLWIYPPSALLEGGDEHDDD